MKTVGQFIKERRVAQGLSARELAHRANMSGAHIRYIEEGKRRPTFDRLMDILNALGAGMGEFLSETGYGEANVERVTIDTSRKVPVVSWVTAGKRKEVCDAFEPGDADEWIDADIRGKNVFALRVLGDSMEPEFVEGDVVIINPHVEATPGDFVVVKVGDEATFKQLKKFGQSWVLHPLNPRYPDLEVKKGRFRIIGKVVKKEKKY